MRNANECGTVEELNRSSDLIRTSNVRGKCDGEPDCSRIETGGDRRRTRVYGENYAAKINSNRAVTRVGSYRQDACPWSADIYRSELDSKNATAVDRESQRDGTSCRDGIRWSEVEGSIRGRRQRGKVRQIERRVSVVFYLLSDRGRGLAFFHRWILECGDGRTYYTNAEVKPIGKK